jgi:hypothetical protein
VCRRFPPLPADATQPPASPGLVHPSNPLTARVAVNHDCRCFSKRSRRSRLWRAGPPTHPELLDWLATEFIRTADVKQMHNSP